MKLTSKTMLVGLIIYIASLNGLFYHVFDVLDIRLIVLVQWIGSSAALMGYALGWKLATNGKV